MMERALRWIWRGIAVALVVLPLLPLPEWSGAPDQGPVWWPHVQSWAIGLVVVLVAGGLAGRLARDAPLTSRRWPTPPPRIAVPVLALALGAAASLVMQSVFAANPHLVDEIAQLFHARVFAAGRLAAAAPQPPEAFLITHTWITDAGWVAQYPPGHTLLLTLGLLAHAEWLVNPILGAASLVAVYVTARGLYGRRTALAAAVLWALSAWVLFMSGTYLNHVSAVALALLAWALIFGPRAPRISHLLGAGLALAAAAATRPLDAVAAALPVLLWVGRSRQWPALLWMTTGGLPVMLGWAYINWRINGHPLTLGYTAVYGVEHGMGFHGDPWGQPYTPLIAVSNMAIAIRRLHIYLYEWPIPALLPLAVWAWAARRRTWRDLVVGVGVAVAPALYFFYWHSGFYIGPRFYYACVPWLVFATARAWRWAWVAAGRWRIRQFHARVGLIAAAAIVVLWGWIGIVPIRWDAYSQGLATMKLHPERELAALGMREALVLVPESWGSRTIVRLWGMGVPPGLVERAYRRFDTCDLYRFTIEVEAQGLRGTEAAARLDSVMASLTPPPPRLESWPDPTVRLRPGSTPPPECQVELRRDLEGFTLYGYLGWRNPMGLDSGIVFARDLYERNDQLLARYPGWEVWRYAPPRTARQGRPVLTRVREAGSAAVPPGAP